MTRSPTRPSPLAPRRTLRGIATIAALAAALGLAGCGRKSALDPPPGGSLTDQTAGGAPSAVGPDGKPTQPRARDRHTFLDWLID